MIRSIFRDSLFLGNAIDARDLKPLYDNQIVAVLDLAINERPAQLAREMIYCRFPIVDGDGSSDAMLTAAIRCLTMLIQSKQRTLIACSAGMSRSPAIAAAAIALLTKQSPEQCLLDIVTGAPHDVSPTLWSRIKSVYSQIVADTAGIHAAASSVHHHIESEQLTLPARSERLLDRNRSLLLVVDLQTKLFPLITSHAGIVWNAGRLLAGAEALSVPNLVTEQYPEKLGATVSLGETQIAAVSKRMFSCRECREPLAAFRAKGIQQAVVCGIETHVCVLQTALDLVADGWQVFIAVDATGSRMQLDHETALRRMAAESVVLTTTESVLFEWCETSIAPEFRTISALVRQTSPESEGSRSK